MTLLLVILIVGAFFLLRQKGAIMAAAGTFFGSQQVPATSEVTSRLPTPQEIADQIMPTVSTVPGFTQAVKNDIIESARQGKIVFLPTACTAEVQAKSTGAQLIAGGVTQAGTLALPSLGIAIGSTAFGFATLGLGFLAFPLTGIFSHHSKAVERENTVLCDVIPSVNQLIAKIVEAARLKAIGPADAIERLKELEGEGERALAPISKEDATHCNAACVTRRQMQAAIAGRIVEVQRLK